jgi:hypothetical protein
MRIPASPTLRRSALALLTVLLLAAGFVVGSASWAHADDVTWTVRTASNALGADRTNYAYTINPGSTVDDAIVVANHGDVAVELAVYAADGYTTDSGEFDVLVGGETSASVGAWVHPGNERITVAAGESVEVPFTIQVPDNATPGDYAGAILTSLVQPDQADGISVDRRLGIRMALRVAGALAPSLAVENAQFTWSGGLNPFAGGDAALTYTLHNTGNTVVSAEQAATVSGPFGWFGTDAAEVVDPPRLLPGETWQVTVPFRDVPAAVWLTGAATVIPVVIDASGSTTALAPVEATAAGWAVPWMLLLILLVIAGVAAAAVLMIRRGRKARRDREDARVQEAVDRALLERESEAALTPQR